MRKLQYRICLLLLVIYCDIKAQDRLSGEKFATRSEIIATHGMVATSNPLATQVAIDILKKGGSAVDAAIAANAILALTEPGMCGPGGDLLQLCGMRISIN
ncbi:MAG TPA: gamma-glutamyltransferase [Chitinophagaceae bacterium]|nr:gamma-glutamyltransferase [Chitinophagaceae bacterium]